MITTAIADFNKHRMKDSSTLAIDAWIKYTSSGALCQRRRQLYQHFGKKKRRLASQMRKKQTGKYTLKNQVLEVVSCAWSTSIWKFRQVSDQPKDLKADTVTHNFTTILQLLRQPSVLLYGASG